MAMNENIDGSHYFTCDECDKTSGLFDKDDLSTPTYWLFATYEGNTWYFCSEEHMHKFTGSVVI